MIIIFSLSLILNSCIEKGITNTSEDRKTLKDSIEFAGNYEFINIGLPVQIGCMRPLKDLPIDSIEFLEKLLGVSIRNSQLFGRIALQDENFREYDIFLLMEIHDMNIPYLLIVKDGRIRRKKLLFDSAYYCGREEMLFQEQEVLIKVSGEVVLVKTKIEYDENDVVSRTNSDTLVFNIPELLE